MLKWLSLKEEKEIKQCKQNKQQNKTIVNMKIKETENLNKLKKNNFKKLFKSHLMQQEETI